MGPGRCVLSHHALRVLFNDNIVGQLEQVYNRFDVLTQPSDWKVQLVLYFMVQKKSN